MPFYDFFFGPVEGSGKPMKAIMLAAGVGRRLYGDESDCLPKALLRFALAGE